MVESTVPRVSVVIPVLNARPWLPALLSALQSQQPVPPLEIILVDSGSTDGTENEASQCPLVRILPIKKFSHGGARNLGVRAARGDYIALLTQDACPADDHWLAFLVQALHETSAVAVYARQVPRAEANPMEQFFLADRFPPGPRVVRTARPGQVLLQEHVFFSNVAALIRRDILLQFPFDEELIMSEDQQFSRDVMQAGYAVVYEPSACVIHSHNYSLGVCLRRYFDSVYSLRKLFHGHGMRTTFRVGGGYQMRELRYMLTRHPAWLPYYVLYCGAKVAGTLLAHMAEVMPRWLVRRVSLHRYYWT